MAAPDVHVDPRTAFMHDLRLTVTFLGVDGLVAHLQSAPDDSNLDSALLAKLAALLKMLAEEQELEYSRDAASEMSAGGANNEQPYAIVDEAKGSDDVASTYYNPTDHMEVGGDENVDDPPSEEWPIIDISKAAFPELFPTKETTKKQPLPKSFPNIDEFRGGIHLLSGGNFGWTFKSVFKGVPVVLKVSKTRSEESNRADYHEWSVSEKLKSHPNVLQIIGLCPSFENPFFTGIGTTALIAPLKENGGLREFFDNREKRDDDVLDMAFGMIAGIRSLHEQRAVHRDIAVRNFLVDCDGRVLLCDFGLTEFLPEKSDVLHGPPGEVLPWRNLAPESFRRIFSTKSDIWMYGLALVELLSTKPLWSGVKNFADLRKSLEEKEITMPDMEGFPSIIADIVRDCLQFDPSLRPSANDIAERLVKSQFERDESTRDENWNTDLHRTVINGDEFQLENMLGENRAVMINGVNIRGETPLMLAKCEEKQSVLLSYKKVPVRNSEPSRIPEYFHNVDVLGSLLKMAQNEDVEGIKSLGFLGLSDFAEQMRDQGEKWKGVTPLHVAAKTGNVALLEVLMSLDLFDEWKVNSNAQTALHVAAIHGHTGVIDILVGLQETRQSKDKVEMEASPKATTRHLVNVQDHAGKTALHLSAQYGNLSATDTLLNFGSTDVNIADINGQSPIFRSLSAANTNQKSQIAVLQRFLYHPSVDINKTDSKGETILHKVAREGCSSAARVLLERKDVIITVQEHEHGYTPLHLATRELSDGVVKALLSREDININEPDKYGNSPLHTLAKSTMLSGMMETGLNPLERQHGSDIASMILARNDVKVNNAGANKRTPLHEAVARNNMVVLKQLLAHSDIDVNIQGENDETPLHTAAKSGSVESAKLLFSRDEIDVNALDKQQGTPLHFACRYGCVEIAKCLLSKDNVDANARDQARKTPLHFAAMSGSVEVVKLFLSRDDVDVNTLDKHKGTPLHFAAESGCVEIAKFLLSRDNVDANARDSWQETPLHKAAAKDSVEVSKLLLSRGDVDANACDEMNETPLHHAARSGSVEVAKLLLSREDVDANAREVLQQTPLHYAAVSDSVEVAKLLLSRDEVDAHAPDRLRERPIHCAIRFGSVEVAKLLLSRDDVDADGRNDLQETLRFAARYRRVEVVKFLLSRDDFGTNARGKYQETLLHYAAKSWNVEVMKLLLSRDDVDANASDFQQETPLHSAAWSEYRMSGSVEVAKLLLSRDDVDANARDKGQRTPLHKAAEKGSVEVAKLLLSRDDVDASARNEWHATPLHRTAWSGSVEIAELLLSRDDVDVNARDDKQKAPLHYVTMNNQVEVAKLLLAQENVEADAGDINQETPLHYAVLFCENDVRVVEVLLARDDVNVNAPGKDRKTPLHYAAEKNNAEVAELILSRHGVNAEARDANDMTPLHTAAAKGKSEVTKVLLATDGVDTNARDKKQLTALHHAARGNHHEVAKLLLSRDDVDVEARDLGGNTALDVARESGAHAWVALFQELSGTDARSSA